MEYNQPTIENNHEQTKPSLRTKISHWLLDRIDIASHGIDTTKKKEVGTPQRSTHTLKELKDIRDHFGPGSDIALKSIQKSSGYKITVTKRSD